MRCPLALRDAKPWAWGDLVVYALVAVLIVAVCLAVFLPHRGAIARVQIYYQNALVYDYDCLIGRGIAYAVEGVTVQAEDDLVTVTTPRGTNTVQLGPDSVAMVQADCVGHQCMRAYSPLRHGGEVLVCMPHALRVVTMGDVSNEVVV